MSDSNSRGNSPRSLGELCPIGATALLGAVAVILYSNKNSFVFWSGLAILGLAVCRSSILLHSFLKAGFRREPEGFPWRCFVLIFPVLLFFFGPLVTSAKPIRARSDRSNAIHITWEEVKAWTNDEVKREWSEGRIGVIVGRVIVGNYWGSKSARAIGLSEPRVIDHPGLITVQCEQDFGNIALGLVQVTGKIEYRKHKTTDEYYLVLKVASQDDIVPVERPDEP